MSDRANNGVLGQVKLEPSVYEACEAQIDPTVFHPHKVKLPTNSMTFADQQLLIKLYALTDGRCPIKGCEPWSRGKGQRIKAPITGYAILPGESQKRMHDSRGY